MLHSSEVVKKVVESIKKIKVKDESCIFEIGCGSGAFLYAVTSGRDYSWAGELANDCASRVVKKFGPRLDASDFKSILGKKASKSISKDSHLKKSDIIKNVD